MCFQAWAYLACQLGTNLNTSIGLKDPQPVFHILTSGVIPTLLDDEKDESLKEILFKLLDYWLGDRPPPLTSNFLVPGAEPTDNPNLFALETSTVVQNAGLILDMFRRGFLSNLDSLFGYLERNWPKFLTTLCENVLSNLGRLTPYSPLYSEQHSQHQRDQQRHVAWDMPTLCDYLLRFCIEIMKHQKYWDKRWAPILLVRWPQTMEDSFINRNYSKRFSNTNLRENVNSEPVLPALLFVECCVFLSNFPPQTTAGHKYHVGAFKYFLGLLLRSSKPLENMQFAFRVFDNQIQAILGGI